MGVRTEPDNVLGDGRRGGDLERVVAVFHGSPKRFGGCRSPAGAFGRSENRKEAR